MWNWGRIMKEFNIDLFQQQNENLERLILKAEKAIESKEAKDYIYLLSCYKQFILVNLEFGHIRQILLKVLELNEDIIKLNIKDADCFIAFAKLLAFIKGFGEGYKEKKKILNLFIYNYETAKLLKPNNSDIILTFCYELEGFLSETYSSKDTERKEYFGEDYSSTIKHIYKVLYENYSQAKFLNALDYKLYLKYIKLMDFYFLYFVKYYPEYIAVEIAELLKTKIFPNHDVLKNMPELDNILAHVFDFLYRKKKTFDNKKRLLIISLIQSFENSPGIDKTNDNIYRIYYYIIIGILSASYEMKNKIFWEELSDYIEIFFNRILKGDTKDTVLSHAYHMYFLHYECYERILEDDNEKYKILIKLRDLIRDAMKLPGFDYSRTIEDIYEKIENIEKRTKEKNTNKGAAEND